MSSEARRVKCGVEGCEADREVGRHCLPCYKRLWRAGEVGHSLVPVAPLKWPVRRAYRTLGTYAAVDRLCGLAEGHARALLTRTRTVQTETAVRVCSRLGLDFDALFPELVRESA